MKSIDQLILKAKKICVPKREWLIYIMIGYEENYNTTFFLYNGIKGQGRLIEVKCNTQEEAFCIIENIAAEYPKESKESVPIMDLTDNCMGTFLWDEVQNEQNR